MADFAIDEQFAYADGDLNGNNGGTGFTAAWSGSTAYDVASASPPTGGTKYVTVSALDPTISRTFSATADSGSLYFSLYKTGTTDSMAINFIKTADRAIDFVWNAGGNITINGTTNSNVIVGPSVDWYDFEINFVTSTTMRARGKLSSSSVWGSYSGTVTLGVTGSPVGIDRMTLRFDMAGGTVVDTGRYARFQITDPSAGGGAVTVPPQPTLLTLNVG